MMPHSLPAILEHIRQQNRPNSHGAVLVREIERLTQENAKLREARDHLMALRAVDAGEMPLLTEAEVDAFLAAPDWRADPLENTPIVRGYQPKLTPRVRRAPAP